MALLYSVVDCNSVNNLNIHNGGAVVDLSENQITKFVHNIQKNNYKVNFFHEKDPAVSYLLSCIENEATIGIGGSVTIDDLHLEEYLTNKNCIIYRHSKVDSDKKMDHRLMSQRCDYYLCSTNAITMNGELINMDGTGDRVSSIIFGPKNVFIIAGVNKIVEDIDSGITRIKEVAAPKNAIRKNKNTPCAIKGICIDCNSPERMCNTLTILNRKPRESDIELIIVNAKLGY